MLLNAVLLQAGVAACARAEQLPRWEAGVGAAAVSLPHYRGSDERKSWLLPFPYVVYRGEILQADERRIRGRFFRSEETELDISISATPPVDSGDNAARRGMPDLDPIVEIGPSLNIRLHRSADRRTRLELRLPVRAAIATDFSHADFTGWLFQPSLNLDLRDAFGQAGWKLGVLAGPTAASGRYHQYFYAVDPAFATAARPAYNPGGGYAGSQLIAALSRRYRAFWVGGFVKWDTLDNAVFEDSPLVRSRQYFAAGIAVAWILGVSTTQVEVNR